MVFRLPHLRQGAGNETGRGSNHAQPDQENDKGENPSTESDRVYVSIADRCQRHYCPPQGMQNGTERFWLNGMLKVVYSCCRYEEQDEGCEEE